jgi:hypothetical protein
MEYLTKEQKGGQRNSEQFWNLEHIGTFFEFTVHRVHKNFQTCEFTIQRIIVEIDEVFLDAAIVFVQ